ncbi:MAG: tetratricopeptide repeat protein, partial [Thermoanaerobaculia bacterium]
KKAFKRDTNAETMAAIMRDEPPELSESGRNISPALDHIVKHCLEKDRDRRFHSAHDIAFALSEASGPTTSTGQIAAPPIGKRKVLMAAAAIFVLAAAGIFLLRRTQRGGGEAGGVMRVAVLPFENQGAPEDDYFADGIADAIRGKLTSVPGVEVIARGSSIPYKKTAKSPAQIARELDVQYLLTATVRWQKGAVGASRVEVSPELVEVRASGAPTSKWQQPFDAALTDVFQVQSDIATRVAQSLGGALGAGEEKRLAETPTANLAAYDAFLKGEEASSGVGIISPPSLRRALAFYEQAVALDPGYAQAWAQVARANAFLYTNGMPTPALAEHARQAAERAVALAPNRPEGYLALGDYQRKIVKDRNRALEQYAQGQLRAPGNADLLSANAMAEQDLGRWEAAVDHLRQAERLDPRSLFTVARLGSTFLSLRRYPEALDTYDRGLALAPASLELVVGKAVIFLAQGDLAGARDVLNAAPKEVEPTALVASVATTAGVWVLDEQRQKLLLRLKPSAFDGDNGTWGLCLAQAYALKGDPTSLHSYAEEARRAVQEQLRMAPENSELHLQLGVAFAYLGRREEAVREAARAAKDPDNPDWYGLVYIYLLVGESDTALDQLESLLKIPYFLSPGWLKIDPAFDPLRQNPRFQRLVAAAK